MELIEGVDNKQQLQQLKKKIKNYYIIDFTKEVSGLSLELVEKYKLSHEL
ncbi:MAG: type II toxin-antitoxin system VapC family toxin [Chlorobi bacterium]|nr:type II toxin-antitoxin system VapC family toxin [Chlorobiota bacterium]